jgi:hypothetical protein
MFHRLLILLTLCPLLAGCDRETESSQPDEKVPLLAERAQGAAEKEKKGEQVRQPDAITDPSFELRASAEGPFAPGKPGRFLVTVKPRDEYHLNLEFPTSVSVKAPEAIALAKPVLKKSDAAAFGEQLFKFEVPFTPSASGTHAVESRVKFAVCTAKICVPKQETLTLKLAVQ